MAQLGVIPNLLANEATKKESSEKLPADLQRHSGFLPASNVTAQVRSRNLQPQGNGVGGGGGGVPQQGSTKAGWLPCCPIGVEWNVVCVIAC